MSKIRVLVDCSELNPRNAGGVRSYSLDMAKIIVRDPNVKAILLINNESQVLFKEIIGLLPIENVVILKTRKLPTKLFLLFFLVLNLKKTYLFCKSFQINRKLKSSKFEICYTPTTYLNFKIPNSTSVVTLHDIQEKDLPVSFSKFEKRYRNFRVEITLRYSSQVHLSSVFVKNTLMKHYPTLLNDMKYFVVSEGVDIKRFEISGQSKQRQIVFPARSWPHKNHEVFFQSLQYLDEKQYPIFVLTGANTDDLFQYEPLKYKKVLVKGLISDDELTRLYSESFGVLSCSLYESSSLPILEGIASDCVAIASSIEAHVEMGKDLEIHFFDPENPKELANLIQILTQKFDERQLSTASNEIDILKFSWTEIWKAILDKVELPGN